MLPSQMRHEPLNQLVPLVEFSFDSPRGQKTVANESWVLVCRCELASSGRSNRAIEQRSRTICWRQGTITVVSSRPHTVSVWKAALERQVIGRHLIALWSVISSQQPIAPPVET